VSEELLSEELSPYRPASNDAASKGERTRREKKHWKSVLRQRLIVATIVVSDVFLASLVWSLAYLLQSIWGNGELNGAAVAAIAPSIAMWVGLRALLGLYPGYGLDSVERLRRHTYSVFATLAMLTVFSVALQVGDQLSRRLLMLAFLGLLFSTPFIEYLVRWCMKKVKLWGRPVIVLSYENTGTQYLDHLEQEWGLGYKPVALFDYHLRPAGEPFEEAPYEETLASAMNLGREQGIDTCIFAMPYTRREQLASMVSVASESFRHVVIIPNLAGVTNSAVTARDLTGIFAVEIKHNLLDPWAQRLKRVLDLFGVVVGGLLISPLLLAIVVLIKLDSSGPVFYGHRRLGAKGEYFHCWKFRTMSTNAEWSLDEYLQKNTSLQAEWEQNHKLREDPRVTRVGRFLRKLSLDELPQLWNVLRAEMSLTGPRPIVDAEIPKYKKNYALYKRIKPGMSGFWQVGGRSDTDYEERVAMDSYYVRNWSVWLDIIILARTVKIVLAGKGAY
jgi:Undecaprenyl-phosphate galactose phosphotransferase WbaP